MIVFVEDINKNIDLPPNCVSGGEGDVYIKDGFAYKIYHDINKALSKQKFEELKQLDRPNIIKPESLLYDNQHNIIGYKYACDGWNGMCKKHPQTARYQKGQNSYCSNNRQRQELF